VTGSGRTGSGPASAVAPVVRVRRPRRISPGTVVAAVVVVLVIVASVAPQLIAPGDPLAIDPIDAFQGPSPSHPFGTDESGRDVFTRVVHGAAASLTIGVAATAIGVGLALVLGLIAGLGPRVADFATTRLLEVLFAFPGLLLALLVIVVAGPGVVPSTVAVGLSTAPGYARIIRSQVLVVRRSPYLEAALVLGRGPAHRLLRHLLPNVAGSLFALATLGIGQSVVWASSLSYLGLGAVPPAAEWGAMLSAGRTYLQTAWWLTFFPGLAIVAVAAATTVLGRALQSRRRSS
jgi:peptide/nickel transport system permease protein